MLVTTPRIYSTLEIEIIDNSLNTMVKHPDTKRYENALLELIGVLNLPDDDNMTIQDFYTLTMIFLDYIIQFSEASEHYERCAKALKVAEIEFKMYSQWIKDYDEDEVTQMDLEEEMNLVNESLKNIKLKKPNRRKQND